ncbi:hypothetical protein BC351_01265 [Paenibacillus ferrarius]|uniref:Uncharacterized protein n=1 Tax=Paenibacillus ferrarius TaxID=1469647 RepID=A0A1V4HSK3_9BACL|nr:hypothetical protein [Paenibacillus ferrarius]OPH61900.1 hypothetical protein BC351_01265 [Paenibacillus ferrarius]
MCYAYKSLSNQIQQLQSELGIMSEELSVHDKAISNLTHELEDMTFDVSDGYKIAKTLQEMLLKRRRTKYEISQIRSLKSHLESLEFKLKDNEKKLKNYLPHNWDRVIHSNKEEFGKDLVSH